MVEWPSHSPTLLRTPTHIITPFIISMHQLFVCTYSHVLVIHSEQVIPMYSLRTIYSHASPSYITYLCLSMHWACSGGFSIYWPSCACFCRVVLSCLNQHSFLIGLNLCQLGFGSLNKLWPCNSGGSVPVTLSLLS